MANNSSILDVVSGKESFKLEISLDMVSVAYLAATVFVVGIILILISKKVIK